jgi:hypothetical protein
MLYNNETLGTVRSEKNYLAHYLDRVMAATMQTATLTFTAQVLSEPMYSPFSREKWNLGWNLGTGALSIFLADGILILNVRQLLAMLKRKESLRQLCGRSTYREDSKKSSYPAFKYLIISRDGTTALPSTALGNCATTRRPICSE